MSKAMERVEAGYPPGATHTAYGMTIGRTTGETHISSSGSYEDELVKVGGEWLIKRRHLDQQHPHAPRLIGRL